MNIKSPVVSLVLSVVLAESGLASDPVVEFNVATGAETPLMASPPWSQSGEPMELKDDKLVQNPGRTPVLDIHSYYLSPELGGLIASGERDYAIEFKVKPLGDVPSAGNSNYANLVVAWSDKEYAYNVTINQSSLDVQEGSTTGDLNGGGDRLVRIAEGIDWGDPRTIFIGYKAAEKMFHFSVDGEEVASMPADAIALDANEVFLDRVAFGDTTSGQGSDVSAEWHFVRVFDSSTPPQ